MVINIETTIINIMSLSALHYTDNINEKTIKMKMTSGAVMVWWSLQKVTNFRIEKLLLKRSSGKTEK